MSRESEAAGWYARMRGPDANAHRADFEDWMRDPANAAAYAHVEDDWAFTAGLSRKHIAAHARSEWFTTGRMRWAMATIAVVALTLGFGWYLKTPRPEPQFAAPRADSATRLADGSAVTLMNGARIEARFDARRRAVLLLAGRARFEVAHDAVRPFTVIAGRSHTTALGTIFEIDLRMGAPRIALIEGSVAVSAQGRGAPLRLRPGEVAEVPAAGARLVPAKPYPVPTTLLDADDLRLDAIVEHANAANSLPIQLDDPALGALELSGRFDVADSASLARKLAAALDLVVEIRPDGIYLSAPAKKSGG